MNQDWNACDARIRQRGWGPKTGRFFVIVVALCLFTGSARISAGEIEIELFKEFASFLNPAHPGNRIGYRFHEHTPLIYGAVPVTNSTESASSSPPEIARLTQQPGVKIFKRHITEESWIPQDWTFYLVPVADGIEMALVVKTGSKGLPELYGVQQCFRLTGLQNETWRQKYARAPAFSEFDLWKEASQMESLTWAFREGALARIPATRDAVGCRTRYGEAFDRRRSEGNLATLARVGPYQAEMLWVTDAGLILRTSHDQKWSTGLFWERTTHLSDHHPADCLHAIVNIGGIAPESQRILHGKIYWLEGDGATVVRHWRKDFPGTADFGR